MPALSMGGNDSLGLLGQRGMTVFSGMAIGETFVLHWRSPPLPHPQLI